MNVDSFTVIEPVSLSIDVDFYIGSDLEIFGGNNFGLVMHVHLELVTHPLTQMS